jgi:hypothetical protein
VVLRWYQLSISVSQPKSIKPTLTIYINLLSNEWGKVAPSLTWTGWVWNFRKITDHFRGIYRMHSSAMKRNRNMSTCDNLDLKTLGYWPIMSKNPHGHCKMHKCVDQQIEISLYVMEVSTLRHSRKLAGLNHHVCTFNSIRLLASRTQCSRLKSSMPFKHDLALQNATLHWNKNVTWIPQYNLPVKHCSYEDWPVNVNC